MLGGVAGLGKHVELPPPQMPGSSIFLLSPLIGRVLRWFHYCPKVPVFSHFSPTCNLFQEPNSSEAPGPSVEAFFSGDKWLGKKKDIHWLKQTL